MNRTLKTLRIPVLVGLCFVTGCASTSGEEKAEPIAASATKPLDPGTAEFWDSAYAGDNFVYGEEPNTFFASFIDTTSPGAVLLPGEGEGRNAVYAAQKGWDVHAFDLSDVAKRKAEKFAARNGVTIKYQVADFSTVQYPENSFDVIAIVFLHLPSAVFEKGMPKLLAALKPGGELLIQVFSENHAASGSSFGPKSKDVLLTIDEIKSVLGSDWTVTVAADRSINLDEGRHQGAANVLEFRATKLEAKTK